MSDVEAPWIKMPETQTIRPVWAEWRRIGDGPEVEMYAVRCAGCDQLLLLKFPIRDHKDFDFTMIKDGCPCVGLVPKDDSC